MHSYGCCVQFLTASLAPLQWRLGLKKLWGWEKATIKLSDRQVQIFDRWCLGAQIIISPQNFPKIGDPTFGSKFQFLYLWNKNFPTRKFCNTLKFRKNMGHLPPPPYQDTTVLLADLVFCMPCSADIPYVHSCWSHLVKLTLSLPYRPNSSYYNLLYELYNKFTANAQQVVYVHVRVLQKLLLLLLKVKGLQKIHNLCNKSTTYCSGTWTWLIGYGSALILKEDSRRLQAFHMTCQRRIQQGCIWQHEPPKY